MPQFGFLQDELLTALRKFVSKSVSHRRSSTGSSFSRVVNSDRRIGCSFVDRSGEAPWFFGRWDRMQTTLQFDSGKTAVKLEGYFAIAHRLPTIPKNLVSNVLGLPGSWRKSRSGSLRLP
jgi:hypothetical protein